MVLEQKIMNLISGITDPSIRIEIARTIKFLFEVWVSGRVPANEILRDLKDVTYMVVSFKFPLLSEEELKKKADDLAEDIFKAFKLESMFRMSFVRHREKIMF
ncbi:MAG: hypothetical protein DRO23_05655 [Thermoprotei archaeon]|nr:MAG: hypothetical protein DRO23_05655 [Thermoprotei archaeon]